MNLFSKKNIKQGYEDSKMEAEALSRLILGRKLLDQYKNYEIPTYLSKV